MVGGPKSKTTRENLKMLWWWCEEGWAVGGGVRGGGSDFYFNPLRVRSRTQTQHQYQLKIPRVCSNTANIAKQMDQEHTKREDQKGWDHKSSPVTQYPFLAKDRFVQKVFLCKRSLGAKDHLVQKNAYQSRFSGRSCLRTMAGGEFLM